MYRLTSITIVCVLMGIIFPVAGWCAAPQTMSFQGFLTGSDSMPVADGSYTIAFSLYTTETGGTADWTESQTVKTKNGIYNVVLGDNPDNTLLSKVVFDKQYWLGVKVGNDAESTPRFKLTASPYSLMAKAMEDNAITNGKIANGQVVKSINGLNDDVILQAGTNVSITKSGQNITFSSSNGGGIIAGKGLTSSLISGNVTLDVGQGTGITVGADSIYLNTTYIDGLYEAFAKVERNG